MTSKPTDRVRVYKFDGSLQCGQGKAIPAEEMRKQLGDIEVHQSENRHDGQMHTMRCGGPTGQVNIFEIDRKDLDQAKKLGFSLWTFE